MGKKNKRKAKPIAWADDFAENTTVQDASAEGQPEQISLEQPVVLNNSEPAALERKPTDEGYVSSNEPPSPSPSKAAMAPDVSSVIEEEGDDTEPTATNSDSTLDLSEVGGTDLEGEPTPVIEMPEPVLELPEEEEVAAPAGEENLNTSGENTVADEEDETLKPVLDPSTLAVDGEGEEASTDMQVGPISEGDENDNDLFEPSDLPSTDDPVVVEDSEESVEGANDETSGEPQEPGKNSLTDSTKPGKDDTEVEEDSELVDKAESAEEALSVAAEESPKSLTDKDDDLIGQTDVIAADKIQGEGAGVTAEKADKDAGEVPQAADASPEEAKVTDEVLAVPDEKAEEPAERDDAPVAEGELANDIGTPEAVAEEAAPDASAEATTEDELSVDAGTEVNVPEAEATIESADAAGPDAADAGAADAEDGDVTKETLTDQEATEEPAKEESTENETPGAILEDDSPEVEQEAGQQPEPEQAAAEDFEPGFEAEAVADVEETVSPLAEVAAETVMNRDPGSEAEPEAEPELALESKPQEEVEADTAANLEPGAELAAADEAELKAPTEVNPGLESEPEQDAEAQKDVHGANMIAAASAGVAAAVAVHEIKKQKDKKRDKHWEREPPSPTTTTKDGKYKLERSKNGYKSFNSAVARQIEKAKEERGRWHETDDYKERLRRRHEKRDAKEAEEAEERRKRRSAERKAEETRRTYETAMKKKKDDLRREAEKRESRGPERKHRGEEDERMARPASYKHPTVHGNSTRRSSNGCDRDRPALLKRITTGGESDTGGPLLKINMAKAGGYDPPNIPRSSAGSPPQSLKSPLLTRTQTDNDSTSGTDIDGHRRHRHRRRHHDRHGTREESIETSSRMEGDGRIITREKLIRRVTSNDKEYYDESPGKKLWRKVQQAINA